MVWECFAQQNATCVSRDLPVCSGAGGVRRRLFCKLARLMQVRGTADKVTKVSMFPGVWRWDVPWRNLSRANCECGCASTGSAVARLGQVFNRAEGQNATSRKLGEFAV